MKFTFLKTIAVLTLASACATSLQAASQTWDPTLNPSAPVGGAGAWNTTTANWSNGASDAVWGNSNTSDAVFAGTGTAGTVTIDAGATVIANDLTFSKKDYTISGGVGAVLNLASADANAPVITVTTGTSGDLATITAKITGTQGLTKSNSNGALLLSGPSTYTGVTSVLGGELRFTSIANVGGGASSLGAPTNTTDGTIQLNNGGMIVYKTGGSATSDRAVNIGSGAGQISVSGFSSANTTLTLSGGITGSGQLTLRGNTSALSHFEESGVIAIGNNTIQVLNTVTATLSNNSNTFTGKLFMNGGQVTVTSINSASGVNSAAGAGSILSFAGGGTLVYTGTGVTSNRTVELATNSTGNVTIDQSGASGALKFTTDLSNAGSAAQANAKTLVLQGSGSGTGEFAGKLSDAVTGSTTALSVTKNGTGTWTLSGANTYTGSTTVSAGTLLINGSTSASSVINVSSGATLGGNGTIGGALTIGANGTLAPGNSPGNLTVNNNVTIADSGALSIQVNGATVGTEYDRVTLTGSGSVFSLTGTNNLVMSLGYAPANNALFFLVDNQGISAISGVFEQLNGTTTTLTQGSRFTVSGQDFLISYTGTLGTNTFSGSGNDLVIQAVPEPATWALLAFSLTTVLVLRRRRA